MRKQFSIRIYFSITINKLQEQLLFIVKIDLFIFYFNYKQLYIALLCAKNIQQFVVLYVVNAKQYTSNIIYSKILLRFNI